MRVPVTVTATFLVDFDKDGFAESPELKSQLKEIFSNYVSGLLYEASVVRAVSGDDMDSDLADAITEKTGFLVESVWSDVLPS